MVFCFYTDQTCPTIQSSKEEICVDECSSDDDCHDRICCSNGCGGHTCSDSVEMCQVRSVIDHDQYLMSRANLTSINIEIPILLNSN